MTDHDRPDPDTLLARIRQDEARAGRGRLRIYFGSSAGVGKTYAMLQAARAAKAQGRDVLAGVVETHGRSETASLLDGLPLLPLARTAYRGRQLDEFDLDAALERRPGLILVDELAHSNVAGSRHPKRWQDVEELLGAGIDVYTTLNVQHLESLNDVVGGITGVLVHETLPDTFFDAADEVVLVDTPADELIARLAAGKVYLPAQAERAARNFFRKGNLMALRELALRRTADRVEDDVQAWRSARAITQVWKTEAALLCCIGPREGAEHVVRSAARLAQQLNVAWHAVYVETPALQRLPDADRQRILRAVKLAQELGATAAVLSGQDVASTLVEHARHHNLSKLVLGRNPQPGWWRRRTGRLLGRVLAALAPDVDLIEVGERQPAPRPAPRPGTDPADDRAGPLLRYVWAAAACGLTTLLALPLHGYFDLANIVMVFLLAVVTVAVTLGRGPAVLAAFTSVAAFDFFFVAPRLSFAVSDVQYLLTFFVMLVVALVTGQLTAGLRYQVMVARHREARSRALFEAARDLSNALLAEQVVDLAEQGIAREFRAQALLYVLDANDRLRPPRQAADGLDLGTAQWALDHQLAAGWGTHTLPGSPWLYLPLKAPMRARGVLAVHPREPRLLMVPEQRQQLDTFAALIAMALERVHYVEVAQQATVQIESERLRNSLLSALSHDLRTPLAALVGLADSMAMTQPPLPDAQSATARAIRDEALRMSRMVDNLLDMARLQSGEIKLRLGWQSVEELAGTAIAATRAALGARPVSVRLDDDLPLVECDAVLIERVLGNLLENAAKYTPAGSPVQVFARRFADELRIGVLDEGPGVAKGQEEAIFEKFTRGHAESATPGVGLGLAICRAIVQAHRGRIWAEANTPHGAVFTFTLPLGSPPPLELTEEAAADAASTGATA
jgi:two-component system sensor histidine kinase KdpD